jgi:predicted NBD/HSP70 family sugar kinase
MAHFVGLDVSVKETSVCVMDDTGKVLCERKVSTEPDDIAVLLTSVGGDYVRVGICEPARGGGPDRQGRAPGCPALPA